MVSKCGRLCMASRRSSQLSYIRVGASIALARRTPRPRMRQGGDARPVETRLGRHSAAAASSADGSAKTTAKGPRSGCVQRLVHEAVGELVVRTANVAVVDVVELPRQTSGLERELAKRLVLHLVLTEHLLDE